MSMRYKGGVISATPPTTSSSSAPGIWTLEQQMQAQVAGNWPLGPVGWITLINSLETNTPPSIATDNSKNVYIVGRANNGFTSAAQLTKIDEYGVITWQKTLGATSPSSLQDGSGVVVDSSLNVYISGNDGGGSYAIIAKYNSSGVLQWQRQLGTAGNSTQATRIAIDNSANLYISGGNATGCFVCKYNSSGVLQWQRQLNVGSRFEDICVDSSSNVYVTGSNGFNPNIFTIIQKYDTTGTLQWQRSLVDPAPAGNLYGNAIAVDSSANVFIAGYNYLGRQQIVKYNTSGVIQWQRDLAAFGSFPRGIATDTSGNVYVIGSNGNASFDAQITKYDTNGNLLYQRSFGNSSPNFGHSITTDALGSFYAYVGSQTPAGQLITKLPGNGSRTGTYIVGGSNITYSTTSYADAATSYTDSSTSYTTSAGTMAETAATLTSGTSSLTSSTTVILGN